MVIQILKRNDKLILLAKNVWNIKKRWILLISISFLIISCGNNPMTLFSNKSTDEAIYEDAIKLYHDSQFTASIQKFQNLSPSFLNKRSVRLFYAKSLAGKCGYTFLDFLNKISNTTFGGSNTFFESFLSMWGNTTILPSFCTQAESQIKIIWSQLNSPSERTMEEKFLMALISLAKIGMYLRYKYDIAENSGLGNGVADSGIDSCTNSNAPLFLSDSEVKEIITGLALFLENITAIGSVISNLSSISGVASTICSIPGVTLCSATNAQNITATEVTHMRKLLRSSATGVDGNSCVPIVSPDDCCP